MTRYPVPKRLRKTGSGASTSSGASVSPSPVMVVEAPEPKKSKKETHASLSKSKGSASKKLTRTSVFKFAPVFEALKKTMDLRHNDGGVKLRWSSQAVMAIASLIEIKLRKILKEAIKIMLIKGRGTLDRQTIIQALDMLGEPLSTIGGKSAQIKVSEAAIKTAGVKKMTKEDREKARKDRASDRLDRMAALENEYNSDLKLPYNAPVDKMFVPSTLNKLLAIAGLGKLRASQKTIRITLFYYTCNFIDNIVRNLRSVMKLKKQSTVKAIDVRSVLSEAERITLLGFSEQGIGRKSGAEGHITAQFGSAGGIPMEMAQPMIE